MEKKIKKPSLKSEMAYRTDDTRPLGFLKLFSFAGKIIIQQDQSKHHIDHHKCIHPGIVEEFAEINLIYIFCQSCFLPGTCETHLPKSINKKSNDQCDEEETNAPDYFIINV